MTAGSPSRALATRCVSRALRSINIMNCLLRRGVRVTPRRILVVKLDAIGDLVLATPFLRELKRSFPDAMITLVVTPATAPLVRLCPYVDKILEYEPFGSNREDRDFNTLRAHLFATQALFRPLRRRSATPLGFRLLPWLPPALRLRCAARRRLRKNVRRSRKSTWAARVEQRRATIVKDESLNMRFGGILRLIEALGGTVASDKLELWLSDRRSSARRRLAE